MAETKQSRHSRGSKTAGGHPEPTIAASERFDEERQLTTHEVGKLLQVNASSVVKWINDGILPAYRTPGGHRRVVVRDLRDFAIKYKMFVPTALRS